MLGIVLAPKNNAQKGLLLIKCECVHIWGFSPYVLQFSKEKTEGFVNMTNPPQPNSVAAVILCYFVSSFRLIINKKHFVTIIFKSVIYIRLLHQKIRKQAFFGLFFISFIQKPILRCVPVELLRSMFSSSI